MDGSTTPAAAKRDGAAAMRIAVLQHTHTAKPAYIFRRAREQIVQWRAGHSLVQPIAMDHHVSLWADHAEQCQSTLKAIADELGSYENLTCIESDTISATLPALSYASVARMRRAGPHTRYLSATNKSFQWSWNSGDAAILFCFRIARPGCHCTNFIGPWSGIRYGPAVCRGCSPHFMASPFPPTARLQVGLKAYGLRTTCLDTSLKVRTLTTRIKTR